MRRASLNCGLALGVLLAGAASGQSPDGAPRADWSPESAPFVFTSAASGNSDLWLQRGARGVAEQLTRDEAQDHVASWFPGGDRVAFQTRRDGQREVYVMAADGSNARNLTAHPADDLLPDVSPDGRRIAFHAGEASGEARIVVMNRDGSERHELTRGAQHYKPHWSPDGRWVMFTGAPLGATQFDLMIVSSVGGEVKPLVATGHDERGGSWSPVR